MVKKSSTSALFSVLILASLACGKSKSKDDTTDEGTASAATDPAAAQESITSQLDAVNNSIAEGAGGGSAALVENSALALDGTVAKTAQGITYNRTCSTQTSSSPVTVTLVTTMSGTSTNGYLTYNNASAADLTANTETEINVAGANFGSGTNNIGFSSTVGVVGAPTGNQPTALACDSNNWPLVGWRFSNNVAGLTKNITFSHDVTRTNAKSKNTARSVVSGTRSIVMSDPATVPPYVAGTTPYFDLTASPTPIMTVTKSINIGSATKPNSETMTFTNSKGKVKTTTITRYTDKPLVETMVRDITPGGSWPWLKKTVASGTVISSTADATIKTVLTGVVYSKNLSTGSANPDVCLPTAGVIVNTITASAAGIATKTITLRFGSSVSAGVTAASGVSVQVECGSTGTGCAATPEGDDESYKPSRGCALGA